jgi:hypothetical protein
MCHKSSTVRSTTRRKVHASLLALASALVLTAPAAAEPWPTSVQATYRIAFNGFDIGSFAFRATVDGRSYTVEGDARISALLGAFQWRGISRSSGSITDLDARPVGYSFAFNGTGKSGSIRVGFKQGNVTSVALEPQTPPRPGTIPLHQSHLHGVLDPLSAVLALSRARGGNVCARRIPVFDGKQRFDLVFSYLRQQNIAETHPSGQPGVAIVCRVRYVPLAGHVSNSDTEQMASSGIEVAMRPVPSAGIHVPYQITVPTFAGSATLTSETVEITTRMEQIALRH